MRFINLKRIKSLGIIMSLNEKVPPLNALRAFDAVARSGSIAAAARNLHVSASSISQHINSLETFLNVSLFERTSNTLVLTQPGEIYFKDIRHAFDVISQATHNLTTASEDGPLRISVIPSLAHGWLLDRLELFEEQNPSTQLSIVSTAELVRFDLEDVDIAIRYGAGNYEDAEEKLLLKDFVAPVCTPEFARNIETPFDILKHRRAHSSGPSPLVVTKWLDWGKNFLPEASSRELDKGNGPIFDDAIALLRSVQRGRCIGLARYSLAKKYLDSGELIAPVGSWVPARGGYYILTAKRRSARVAAKKFRSWVKRQIREDIGLPFK
ncbi:LysR family transcriptional regulator [Phaeobacter inhibens]|uniref:LysR family transcriptional regulator n=1 Tax=Phaeobacter inhibens TaxID=221822 RepID=UPI002752B3E5|nr:LysR family transcriptional regulator [Phaeobacter inhibens]GLO71892.1 LysR family transcriptional regulator [Phaeobacter inhibens]